jgi:hypothetical protein
MCQPFGLGGSWDASTGGYHHRQRVCQPFGLEKAQRLPFGYKPGGLAQPLPGSKAPVARLFKPQEARRADTTSAGVEGPGNKALQTARGPEGRHTLDLVGRQNPVTLGCASPSGLANS